MVSCLPLLPGPEAQGLLTYQHYFCSKKKKRKEKLRDQEWEGLLKVADRVLWGNSWPGPRPRGGEAPLFLLSTQSGSFSRWLFPDLCTSDIEVFFFRFKKYHLHGTYNTILLGPGICNILMRILLGVSGSQFPPKSFQRTTLTLRKRFQVACWCDFTRIATPAEAFKALVHHLSLEKYKKYCYISVWQSEMFDCLREMQTNKQLNFEHFLL